jgi:hypothetical protein
MTLICGQASAITAQDVMEKMSKQDRFNYLTGLINMLAFEATHAGDAAFPQCLNDAYYRDDESAAWDSLLGALQKFPDHQPAAIVFLLAQKACGK